MLTLKASFQHLQKLDALKNEAAVLINQVTLKKVSVHQRSAGADTVEEQLPSTAAVPVMYKFIQEVAREINRVKHAIKRANVTATVDWTEAGRKLTIDEARTEAQRLRAEHQVAHQLGQHKATTQENWSGVEYNRDKDGKQVQDRYKVTTKVDPTFDTKAMRDAAIQIDQKITTLSNLVEQAEVSAPIDFVPAIDVYLSLEEQLDRLMKESA